MTAADECIEKFHPLLADMFAPGHRVHYLLDGGRGSTKSSFIGVSFILLLIAHPLANGVAIRKVSNTLHDSVFAQLVWAVEALGLGEYFSTKTSPLEIKYLPTGQRIVFRGADDMGKLKSTKFARGYPAIVWFEELDQFDGWEQIRNAQQSLMRGGSEFWYFYSYNPPRSHRSWVNRRAEQMGRRSDSAVVHSTYLDVIESGHADWLGPQFVEEAEQLMAEDPDAYRHEYLGEAVGNSTDVFDRVEFRTITDEEIASFDNPQAGQDFGWYPDPWAFTVSEYQRAQRALLTYYEDGANKLHPGQQAERIARALDRLKLSGLDVFSDDADPQSIAAQRDAGVRARKAGKGGKREASYKFLQSLKWVIDPDRCPRLAEEVRSMEYETTKAGEVLNRIPDGNDHFVDATRYALMPIVARAKSAYRR